MIRSGLVFRIPRCGFRVPGQLDSRCQWNLDYGFLQLNSGFTKFEVPDYISRNVPNSGFLKQRFLDSRIRISLHGARLQLYAGGCDRPNRPYSPLSHYRWFHMTDAIAGTLLKTNWKSRQSGQSLFLYTVYRADVHVVYYAAATQFKYISKQGNSKVF